MLGLFSYKVNGVIYDISLGMILKRRRLWNQDN